MANTIEYVARGVAGASHRDFRAAYLFLSEHNDLRGGREVQGGAAHVRRHHARALGAAMRARGCDPTRRWGDLAAQQQSTTSFGHDPGLSAFSGATNR